ncbi:hypothetical protein Q604_UNBC07994G0001, partial [human gut metagenome]
WLAPSIRSNSPCPGRCGGSQSRHPSRGLALVQAGATARHEHTQAPAVVRGQQVLLAGHLRSGDSGEERQSHAGGKTSPRGVKLSQQGRLSD